MGDNLIMHDMLILWQESIPEKMVDILQPHAFDPANQQPTLTPFAALTTLHIQCLCHLHHICHVSCLITWITFIALFRFNAFVAFMPLRPGTLSRTMTSSLHCSVAPSAMSNAETIQSTTTAAPTGATAPSNTPRSTARGLFAFIASGSATGAGAKALPMGPPGDPGLGITSASPLCK
jgi:hypothetical protein